MAEFFAAWYCNRPFPSSTRPPFQSEAKCEVFVMKISFIHIAIGTNYHNKNFALRLALKERLRELGNGLLLNTLTKKQNQNKNTKDDQTNKQHRDNEACSQST